LIRSFVLSAAQSLGYGLLNPYLKAFNSNFTCGANFATTGSKVVDDGLKLFPLPVQVKQFEYFLSQALVSNETASLHAGIICLPAYLYV
jgi:hypothetical protein